MPGLGAGFGSTDAARYTRDRCLAQHAALAQSVERFTRNE